MYATITALSSDIVISNVINSLSNTMAGMSFLLIVMFFLSGLVCVAACLADLLEIKENINMLSETGLGMLKITSTSKKFNKTQHRVLVALQDRYQGYTQADEMADPTEDFRNGRYDSSYDLGCDYGFSKYFNRSVIEFSLNDYRY